MKETGCKIIMPDFICQNIFNKLNSLGEDAQILFSLGCFSASDMGEYDSTVPEEVIAEIQIFFTKAEKIPSVFVFIFPCMYSTNDESAYYRLTPPQVYLREHGYNIRKEEGEEAYIVYDIKKDARFFLIESSLGKSEFSSDDIFELQIQCPIPIGALGDFRKEMRKFFDFVEVAIDGLHDGYGKTSPDREIKLGYSVIAQKKIDINRKKPNKKEKGTKSDVTPARIPTNEKTKSNESQDFRKKWNKLSEEEQDLFENIYIKKTFPLTFADLGGQKKAKEILKKIASFIKHPHIYKAYGVSLPNGILFYGPPGTGKTLCAQIVAHESGLHFFSVSSAHIFDKWLGGSEKRINSVFRIGQIFSPSIIFFDELDAMGRGRSGDSHEVYAKVLLTICSWMDGFTPLSGVVVIGATNKREDLDEALLRPGRFTWEVEFEIPSKEEIFKEIFPIHMTRAEKEKDKEDLLKKERLFGDIDWNTISEVAYEGMTGADVETIISNIVFSKAEKHVEFEKSMLPISTVDFVEQIKEHQKDKGTKRKRTMGFL